MKQNGTSIYFVIWETVIITKCIYPNLIIVIMALEITVNHGDTWFLICPTNTDLVLQTFPYTRVIRQLQRVGVQLYITTDK